MAESEDTTSTTARNTGAAASASTPRPRRPATETEHDREADLEAQVAQLQSDIRSITQTLAKLGEDKVDEVRANARVRAQQLADRGQTALDLAQDEFALVEKQVKDTIREKPLTAVAGAMALGFLIAVITR